MAFRDEQYFEIYYKNSTKEISIEMNEYGETLYNPFYEVKNKEFKKSQEYFILEKVKEQVDNKITKKDFDYDLLATEIEDAYNEYREESEIPNNDD
ncbi:hypothetical protein [Clostridium weizhouense]|uniref:Uncharacterized protein n=1 Tax=Clostridium weizhouense TaxID=2859781 RepID=A0ABS7AJP2_9CLOT|nr:hypothetical protein [Clostridium weizhouense]MBW6408769.1 hypothetical protein [Clostridium weizhouense]